MTTAETQWSIGRLLDWTNEYFRSKAIDEPLLSAQLLLAHVLSCSKVELYLRFDEILSDEHRNQFRGLVKRAAEHEPIAYLVGYKEFFSLEFIVNKNVLIPRPETELLVQWIIRKVRTDCAGSEKPLRILEIGTGTGCISTAIAKNLPNQVQIVAVDKSKEALETARLNIEKHNVSEHITLLESDLFSAIDGDERFDFIVSNPPYITQTDYDTLPAHIKSYEPEMALVSGDDGLDAIRQIISQAKEYLKPKGYLVMEIGYNQKNSTATLLEQCDYENIEFELDASEIARIAIGQNKDFEK